MGVRQFSVSIVRMSEELSNINSYLYYISTGAKFLRIARTCIRQNSFLNFIKLLLRRIRSKKNQKKQQKKKLHKTITDFIRSKNAE